MLTGVELLKLLPVRNEATDALALQERKATNLRVLEPLKVPVPVARLDLDCYNLVAVAAVADEIGPTPLGSDPPAFIGESAESALVRVLSRIVPCAFSHLYIVARTCYGHSHDD
jgi:hypothetical protein